MNTERRGQTLSMQQIIDNLPVVVFEYTVWPDGSRDFTYLSASCEKILGIKREVLLGGSYPMKVFIHRADWAVFEKQMERVIAEVSPFKWEGRIFNINSEVIWIEASCEPVKLPDGRITWSGVINDIGERKELERKKQEADVRYREAATLFSELFNNSPIAIVLLDSEGNVQQVNRGFEMLFGYTITELKGNSLNQFIVPTELETEGNDLNSLISAEQVVRIETTRLRRDDVPVSVIIYGVPIHLEDKTIGIFGVYVDITEQKKIEEELKIRNAELDNFVYKVSHDLRAPLSSVLGLVNLAQMPGNDDNPTEYLKLVGEKVGQLDHFISDVLSHSKNLKLDVKTGVIDFENIINKTFHDLNYMRGADHVALKVTISGSDFHSDPWRMGEIFRNLISNAIKYRKIRSESSEVSIDVAITPDKAQIKFKDNGIGISQENLNRIFEMFYRASEQSEGSGLGLYIVKNAVEKLDGTLTVTSRLNVGTTFEISLPNKKGYTLF
ncbi:MAG: PAS domain-containing sensor histidine kinase [Cyclobacteriaceae bacterium]|nr:PAS domain-containing sensor histidine kinase [Cyclobacteriaceae bacterium]